MYETERLLLKTADSGDVAGILSFLIRNRDFLSETEPARDEAYFSFESQANIVRDEKIMMKDGSLLKFWMMKKEEPGRMIGSVSFNSIIRGPFQSCFLGYRLDQSEINKGYMFEALEEAIKIAFHEYNLHRIETNIMPSNEPSLRLVEKLGFRNEGFSPEYLLVNGRWEDHVRMVLLNEKWRGE